MKDRTKKRNKLAGLGDKTKLANTIPEQRALNDAAKRDVVNNTQLGSNLPGRIKEFSDNLPTNDDAAIEALNNLPATGAGIQRAQGGLGGANNTAGSGITLGGDNSVGATRARAANQESSVPSSTRISVDDKINKLQTIDGRRVRAFEGSGLGNARDFAISAGRPVDNTALEASQRLGGEQTRQSNFGDGIPLRASSGVASAGFTGGNAAPGDVAQLRALREGKALGASPESILRFARAEKADATPGISGDILRLRVAFENGDIDRSQYNARLNAFNTQQLRDRKESNDQENFATNQAFNEQRLAEETRRSDRNFDAQQDRFSVKDRQQVFENDRAASRDVTSREQFDAQLAATISNRTVAQQQQRKSRNIKNREAADKSTKAEARRLRNDGANEAEVNQGLIKNISTTTYGRSAINNYRNALLSNDESAIANTFSRLQRGYAAVGINVTPQEVDTFLGG
jgi:hypothetical protein